MVNVALSSWSLHTLFLNRAMTGYGAEDFPRVARRYFGVRHIEYFEGDYAPEFSDPGFQGDRQAETIRRACEREGVEVVCLAAINDLTHEDPRQRAADRQRVLRLARHCELMGCSVIRVNTGNRPFDAISAERLREELQRLSEELGGSPVRLAIENHPHVLDSDDSIDRLLEVVKQVGRENVRLCPDLGATAPGYWRTALERLAPWAAHVHLKPFVLDGPAGRLGIADYAPTVQRILSDHGYHGAVSLEYLPSLDLITPNFCEETREALLELAGAVGYQVDPDPDPQWPRLYQPQSPTPERNEDKALTPPAGILQLLADGCELRLGAQIEIHDLASNTEVCSNGIQDNRVADGRGTTQTACESDGKLPSFCKLARDDPTGHPACERFHERKRDLIHQGLRDVPRICVCPFGLILLSVPITADSKAYGLISSGPWVEEGTEGMIIDGVLRLISPTGREQIERAATKIDRYSPFKLAEARKLLVRLSQDLGALYSERELTNRYLVQGPKVIERLREQSCGEGVVEPEQFIRRLGKTFLAFEQLVGFGSIALYRCQELGRGRETLDLVLPSEPPERLPVKMRLPLSVAPDRVARVRAEVTRTVEAVTRQSCLVSFQRESRELLVFVFPPENRVSGHLPGNFFEQFGSEVHSILTGLHHISELAVFIDRFKHAISSPLQGISDRILQLRAGLEGKKPLSFQRLRDLVADLHDFSGEAGSILDRFTGRVRLEGAATLRPQMNFSRIDPIKIMEESVRKLSRSAARRQIRIVSAQAISPPALIEADPEALAEVFNNLVENAVKFARDGSVVNVRWFASSASLHPPWELGVPGRRFVVSDHGLGVFPEDMPEIFKPYVQGRASPPNRVIRGTGLGLAICRYIVEAHGGMIRIISRPAPGSEAHPEHERIQDCFVDVIVDLPVQVQHPSAGPVGGE
jgi:signal transduction histidine kinase/sugar phosphate isomerase/epimerase